MREMLLRALASLLLLTIGIVISSPAAGDEKPPTQAVVLDHNEFLCSNCLFGVSDYYVCLEADHKILIGHDKVRSQMHRKTPLQLLERGKTVPIRFDDRYIWVSQPGVKDLKLTQDYTKKIFLNSDRCQVAAADAPK